LFHSADVATLRNRFPTVRQFSDDTRAVVSEPLGDIENVGEAWVEIPESSAVVIAAGQVEMTRLQPQPPA
jgi:glutamine amidotransferase